MRDPRQQEALRRLAAEAATRLTSLVASGEELPFDVAENSGKHTFYRYVPLTGRFVREHADELRSLPAFGPACSIIDTAGLAAPYLEARGQQVPEDELEQAEQMLICFIARLWEGSTEFRLDRARLEAALHELDAEVQDVADCDVLIAPLIGLQMPLPRLELPCGIQIVREDTVEAPAEATRSDGMERRSWEPQFLAVAHREEGTGGAVSAMRMLRHLISVLRLFKEGGVGMGPHAFTPTGEGAWRRIATGVPRTRPGGYRLGEAEAAELAEFAQRLEDRPDPDGSLAWAVSRFEMGCDRPTALEGVSDHLLALRALFEGWGPVGANLPMRAAALIADGRERGEAREKLQSAFELERAMMAGRDFDTGAAIGLAAWLEDGARSIIRGAALGGHGSDVAASADESLIATGLEAGEGSVEQMGEHAEWEPPQAEREADDEPPEPEFEPEAPEPEDEHETSEVVVPDPDAIRIRAAMREEQIPSDSDEPDDDDQEADVSTSTERDWLSEVTDAGDDETMEWPAPVPRRSAAGDEGGEDEEGAEPLAEPRVRHLFPVPDDADWEIGELDYDRSGSRVR